MKYCRIAFRFRASAEISFPANPVNTFRGALGFELQRLACIQRKTSEKGCRTCGAALNCAYALCYETAPHHIGTEFLAGNSDIPHLMVIDSGLPGNQLLASGSSFEFAIQLFGRGIDMAPYVVVAAQKAGLGGLTRLRVPCELERVTDEATNEIIWSSDTDEFKMPEPQELLLDEPSMLPDVPGEIRLKFITPVAFKDQSRGHLTLEPDFSRIIGSLMRRYTAFEASEGNRLDWNFAEISRLARQVKLSTINLEPVYWERFSTRQQQRIPISGVIGQACYIGPVNGFVDLIRAGEIIRCGRSTTFGQGRISYAGSIALPAREPSSVFCG
ncbi:MAG: CRISPR system precrRNA processing endoribonuclease RAMP protein Cas6 [Candidatus Riflebacteria bacterium]|nr:CRISPR system precrRNA processing endoribonuclease RAMP protein Cas6 [Candidatus Riflebacteria bacterium]